MFTRRFILLTGVLVTLNLALWFASPSLALRKVLVRQLFGPKMIRAQVFEKNNGEWNIDRGFITNVNSSQVTLREADGRVQQIPLSSTTKVIGLGGHRFPLSLLAPGWRVVVTWPANGAATSVDVERFARARGNAGFGPSGAPAASLS
jgi:hypothetical protein